MIKIVIILLVLSSLIFGCTQTDSEDLNTKPVVQSEPNVTQEELIAQLDDVKKDLGTWNNSFS